VFNTHGEFTVSYVGKWLLQLPLLTNYYGLQIMQNMSKESFSS